MGDQSIKCDEFIHKAVLRSSYSLFSQVMFMLFKLVNIFFMTINHSLQTLDLLLMVLDFIFVLTLEFLQLLGLQLPVKLVFLSLAFLGKGTSGISGKRASFEKYILRMRSARTTTRQKTVVRMDPRFQTKVRQKELSINSMYW